MINPPIAAIATAPGRGGVGIVRLSGAGLASLIEQLTGKPQSASFAQPRVATLTHFVDDAGQVLDEGLLIYFAGPHSLPEKMSLNCRATVARS